MDNRNRLIAKHKNTSGLRGKINAMCISCIYDPHEKGNWRQQVESCTSANCPLFLVRPASSVGKLGDKTENLAKGIK